MTELLHHVAVLADDIDATRAFYCDVLGFEEVDHPPLPFPGVWLGLDGVPCLHLAERTAYERHLHTLGLERAAGAVDHIAFRRESLDGLAARIQAAGIDAVHNDVPGAFRQIFVTDPNGVRVELNVSW